jgi:hypothetical protein
MKMELEEIAYAVVNLIKLAQDRDQLWALMDMIMNLNIP